MSKTISEVNSKPNFSNLEDNMNVFWKENKIFEKSIEQKEEEKRFSFVDGPPFVSGMPHYGHLLVSIPKDIIPRYWAMKGYKVRRVFGWDCHGLPVETKVNSVYGIKDRFEIENEVGVDKYVGQCRKYVNQNIADWRWYIEKIGRWVDLDNAYKTMDPEFNESVIWAFKEIWDKGLVYKGKRVSLYSTDTSTPVSNFEVAMDDNYQDVEDLSIFVKFTLKTEKFEEITEGNPLRLIAWTTTPWTIPANFGLALNAKFKYAVVKYEDEYLVVAKDQLEFTFGEEAEYEVLKEIEGSEFEGMSYEPAYDFFKKDSTDNDWKVYLSNEVVEDEGTGILHIAPGFGEVDFNCGKEWGLSAEVHIDEIGNMKDGDWKGIYIREASPMVTEDLKKQGKLLRSQGYTHRLPFYRGDNPLIYMAQDSYFIDVQKIKPRMLELEKEINWIPDTFKKRFHNVVENAPDWAISRNRYWATILPIWESGDGDQIVVGSRDEMMEYTDQIEKKEVDGKEEYYIDGEKMSLHRDFCDKLIFKKEGKEYHRIPEVMDSWLDSGSVPFAEHHYPFENKEEFEKSFPADFIVEYTGQIRAWFNVLFRMSVMLFDEVPYKNVICSGVMFGTDGRKMSKSYGNYPDPKQTLEKFGGEAMRLYLMSTPIMTGGDIVWSDELLRDQVKDILIPIWNTYRYLSMYANLKEWTPTTDEFVSDNMLDKWIENYIKQTAIDYSEALERYDLPSSIRLIQPCIDNISKWWIRRSRDRFAEGNEDALQTLYASMILFSKIFAPQMPFLMDEIYQNLVVGVGLNNARESVHLEDYPKFKKENINTELLAKMDVVREVCSNGLKVREDSGLNLRQPLSKAYVSIKDSYMQDIVRAELNVKEVENVEAIVEGDGLQSSGDDEFFVTLDISLTDELRAEGVVNDFVRKYRNVRKKKGLQVNDMVDVVLEVEDEFTRSILEKYVQTGRENLQAKEVSFEDSLETVDGEFEVNEVNVKVLLKE